MEINLITLLLAYLIPVTIFIILKLQENTISSSILKSTIVMTIQLTISVFILTFVFNKESLIITMLYLISMTLFSFKTLKSRVDNSYSYLKESAISIAISAFTLIIIVIGLLNLSFEALSPRYIIPLFGMILGNTTTATILASNEVHNILVNNREKIVNLTNLGVPTRKALNEQLKVVIAIALTPTLASMLNIGVVSLPGMMTGQILAGQMPVNAVMYQILIMLAIMGGTTMSILLLKFFAINNSQNKNHSLK